MVLPTFRGEDTIGAALSSLADQTLPGHRFETLVVLNGPQDGTPELVRGFAEAHPELHVRTLVSHAVGAAAARNLGLAEAGGRLVTFLDDDDRVSPGFLAGLVQASQPGVVPVAPVVDVPTSGALDEDTYVNRALQRFAGSTVAAPRARTAIGFNAAKAVPLHLARRARFRTDLRSGEDFVYWCQLHALEPFEVHVLPLGGDAVYYRGLRPGSVSRQGTSYDFNVTQRLDCIAALEQVAPRNPATDRLVRGLARAQCGFLNAFLREHPEQLGTVRGDVAARGLAEVDWGRVEDGVPGV